ncbi:Hypothetical predicted protein [Cloeon dipterum]|uniref:Uncharacterized protein n=1 Tax=Cloeon dipterum TaxID=197152 RepID=A0A8S1DD24_9INSE|nr:Hypothetical predicted protein [Cloeon dipterum]
MVSKAAAALWARQGVRPNNGQQWPPSSEDMYEPSIHQQIALVCIRLGRVQQRAMGSCGLMLSAGACVPKVMRQDDMESPEVATDSSTESSPLGF